MHWKLRELIWVPITVFALLAIYVPGLSNTPVFDDRLLTSGDLFAQYGSVLALKPRLLSYGSFVWMQDLFGPGWWKQRLGNLMIHMAVVAALWLLYREILRFVAPSVNGEGTRASPSTENLRPALGLAVGVFALNPVAVYAVAYLIQRSILLATFFVVLALWFFTKALAVRRPGYYVLAVVSYILAVLSKEHAVMAPLAAVPIYIMVVRPTRRQLGFATIIGGLLVAAAGAVLAFRFGDILGKPFDKYSLIYLAQLGALGTDVEKNAFPLSIINQSYLFFNYGMHWLFPYGGWMSIDLRPPFPVSLVSFPQILGLLGFPATIVGGFFLVLRYRDVRALAGLSLLFPATLFLTEFATVWVQDPFVLYRSYLWAIGLPGLILFFCGDLQPRALLIVGMIVGALFSWQALDRVFSMATPELVWRDAIAKLPDDPRAVGRWFPYVNHAEVALDQNRLKDAYQDFKASSQLGDRGIGNYNIGALMDMVGKYDQSLRYLNEARKQGYDTFDLDYQRGVALAGRGDASEAYQAFLAAYAQPHPNEVDAKLLAALGKGATATGDHLAAVSYLKRAHDLEPANRLVHLELGMAYLNAGDLAAAQDLFSGLLSVLQDGPAYYGRAVANYRLKKKAEALSDIENARRIGPDNEAVRDWEAKIRALR
jgi:tetratricopeptide (TPR) repeat protein